MNLPDSQDNPENNSTTTRNISINVTDGINPIAGATVIIGTVTRTTGSAGGCTFVDINDGINSVNVSATGYVTDTFEINVSADNTSFVIELEEE